MNSPGSPSEIISTVLRPIASKASSPPLIIPMPCKMNYTSTLLSNKS